MLTQTVTITQNSTPNIIIGRRSTYETQQVIFDISWLVQTYGEGTAELLIKRPKDASAYPVVAALDGNTLTWTVSETDTQDKGHGECEIYWYVNGGLAKSCICGITILRDIGDTTETAPDPYETWVETLSRLGAETLTNAQAAEQSANNAAQSASEADNSAAAALESEENALNSENAAKASEQAAAASEQGAEQSAMAARQSATEAAQSASAAESSAANAQESADNSSASADRAEQAAASIEGDTERAETAAREAQGAASYASVFADTASAKATEAAGSAATAEQAASTATQEAADASAAATAAVDSASSAIASATAAGNAQTAAETAQGKAEDAQEAAETAAQSIEDSAAQIDENTAGLVELRSALNTKAGILRDTVSGSVASIVPDATIDHLLGLDVHLEPIQDLHGYDSPWPAGGGKNKLKYPFLNTTKTVNGITFIDNGDGTLSISGTATSITNFDLAAYNTAVLSEGDYIVSLEGGSNNCYFVYGSGNSGISFGMAYGTGVYAKTIHITASGIIGYCVIQVPANATVNLTAKPMIRLATETDATFAPYSNICPISGRESVEVEAAGKNLLDKDGASSVINGYINSSGVFKTSSSGEKCVCVFLPAGTYTVSKITTTRFIVASFDSLPSNNDTGTVLSTNPNVTKVTFTIDENKWIVCFIYNNTGEANTFQSVLDTVQIELGSTASEYKPYAGSRYTIQLGETVYGGDIGVVSGEGESKMGMVDLGTLNWVYHSSSGNMYVDNAISDRKFPNCWALCSIFTRFYNQYGDAAGVADVTTNNSFAFQYNSSAVIGRIIVRDTAYTDATAFKAAMSGVMLCYELATPAPISTTPTEISTVEGENNVFSPDGDVTVEFAADLKTYIDSKIAAAVAAMS